MEEKGPAQEKQFPTAGEENGGVVTRADHRGGKSHVRALGLYAEPW